MTESTWSTSNSNISYSTAGATKVRFTDTNEEKEDNAYEDGYYDGQLDKDMEWRLAVQKILEDEQAKMWMDDHSTALEDLLDLMETEDD